MQITRPYRTYWRHFLKSRIKPAIPKTMPSAVAKMAVLSRQFWRIFHTENMCFWYTDGVRHWFGERAAGAVQID